SRVTVYVRVVDPHPHEVAHAVELKRRVDRESFEGGKEHCEGEIRDLRTVRHFQSRAREVVGWKPQRLADDNPLDRPSGEVLTNLACNLPLLLAVLVFRVLVLARELFIVLALRLQLPYHRHQPLTGLRAVGYELRVGRVEPVRLRPHGEG